MNAIVKVAAVPFARPLRTGWPLPAMLPALLRFAAHIPVMAVRVRFT